MLPLSLTAYLPGLPLLQSHPLPLSDGEGRWEVDMRNLPGAGYLHVLFNEGDRPVFRAEIPARGGEGLRLSIVRDGAGAVQVDCQGRKLRMMPDRMNFPPASQPIDLSAQRSSLDLVIVVDATSRVFSRDAEADWKSGFLLTDAQQWPMVVDKLMALVEALAKSYGLGQAAVLAFGDQAVLDVAAQDLRQPQFLLYPHPVEPGLLQAHSTESLRQRLLSLPPSTGGDWVDALADALAACLPLFWTPSAHKMLLLVGDSPGYSILFPPPAGADACVRDVEVDSQAQRLYRSGIAIATLYLDPDPAYAATLLPSQQAFLGFAKSQYERLASLPTWAFTLSDFDGAAEAILGQAGLLGRGASFGEFLGVVG